MTTGNNFVQIQFCLLPQVARLVHGIDRRLNRFQIGNHIRKVTFNISSMLCIPNSDNTSCMTSFAKSPRPTIIIQGISFLRATTVAHQSLLLWDFFQNKHLIAIPMFQDFFYDTASFFQRHCWIDTIKWKNNMGSYDIRTFPKSKIRFPFRRIFTICIFNQSTQCCICRTIISRVVVECVS